MGDHAPETAAQEEEPCPYDFSLTSGRIRVKVLTVSPGLFASARATIDVSTMGVTDGTLRMLRELLEVSLGPIGKSRRILALKVQNAKGILFLSRLTLTQTGPY